MFHIPSLKAGIKAAGFALSEGENLLAKDMEQFYDWAYRAFGLSKSQAAYGLAYPVTVPATMPGHPANPETPQVAAAPVEQTLTGIKEIPPITEVPPVVAVPPVTTIPPITTEGIPVETSNTEVTDETAETKESTEAPENHEATE